MKRTLLVGLVLCLVAPVAHAGPIVVETDVSDNQFSFTYNSATGDIERASSSRTLRRRDRVAFLLYVRERKDAAVGERLVGRIELELLADKAVRYRGTFSFDVTDALGSVVYRGEESVNLALRPRDGRRQKVLRIPFDLPSGGYNAIASFESN